MGLSKVLLREMSSKPKLRGRKGKVSVIAAGLWVEMEELLSWLKYGGFWLSLR